MRRFTPIVFVLLALALTTAGCHSRLTGTKGKLTFEYPADDDVANFNKPIAPGARLDLFVVDAQSNTEMRVLKARTSASEVIRIVRTMKGHVVLEARMPGTARIYVRAMDPYGNSAKDSVYMHVAEPDRSVLSHPCTTELRAAYPANADDVLVPFDLEREGGQPVIGFHYLPFTVEPREAMTLRRKVRDQSLLHFRTGPPRENVTIRSTLDDAILQIDLIEPGDVDGIASDPLQEQMFLIEGWDTIMAYDPRSKGRAVCQMSTRTRARTLTPQVCSATAGLSDDEDTNSLGLVRLHARSFGICRYEVTFPQANGGEGASRTFSIRVGKLPEREDGDSEASRPRQEERPWYLAPLLALLAPLVFGPIWLARTRRRDAGS